MHESCPIVLVAITLQKPYVMGYYCPPNLLRWFKFNFVYIFIQILHAISSGPLHPHHFRKLYTMIRLSPIILLNSVWARWIAGTLNQWFRCKASHRADPNQWIVERCIIRLSFLSVLHVFCRIHKRPPHPESSCESLKHLDHFIWPGLCSHVTHV